jgi:hypothetical protein
MLQPLSVSLGPASITHACRHNLDVPEGYIYKVDTCDGPYFGVARRVICMIRHRAASSEGMYMYPYVRRRTAVFIYGSTNRKSSSSVVVTMFLFLYPGWVEDRDPTPRRCQAPSCHLGIALFVVTHWRRKYSFAKNSWCI